jgi:hypothetical protein
VLWSQKSLHVEPAGQQPEEESDDLRPEVEPSGLQQEVEPTGLLPDFTLAGCCCRRIL